MSERIDELYEAGRRAMERHWDPLTAAAWADKGGPKECVHHRIAGLPCGRCFAEFAEKADMATVMALIEVYRVARVTLEVLEARGLVDVLPPAVRAYHESLEPARAHLHAAFDALDKQEEKQR